MASSLCKQTRLQNLDVLLVREQGFSESFAAAPEKWRHIYDSLQPYKEALPGELNTTFSSFQKLLVLRVIRPDKIVGAVNAFVLEAMGQRYIEPPQFDLNSAYHDSSAQTPLIFILSAGSDPMAALLKFAEGLKHPVSPALCMAAVRSI